jgi:hypothetical protein
VSVTDTNQNDVARITINHINIQQMTIVKKKKNYVLIIIQKLIQTYLVFGEIIDGNETYCCSVEDHLVMGLIYSIP